MKQAIDFLIDISDKMDGKLSVTENVLVNELIPNLRNEDNFGVRTFLSVLGNPIIIKSIDMGENAKSDFIQKATSLPIPNGGTPLSAVVEESLECFDAVEADRKQIILITAGEETDGGDYEMRVDLAQSGVMVNIVGIGMREQDLQIAQRVAEKTNGVCCNISPEDFDNVLAIRNILNPLIDLLEGKGVATPKKEEKKEEAPMVEEAPLSYEAPAEALQEETIQEEEPVKVEEEKIAVESVPEPKKMNLDDCDVKSVEVKVKKVEHIEGEEFDAVGLITEHNKSISEVLDENVKLVKKVLQNGANVIKENEALREAETANLATIEQLKKTLDEANEKIEGLKSLIGDKEEEIAALNNNKKDLMVTISQWQERDRNVIIDLDAKEREATSRASEEFLNDFLQTKYPGRVKWCNQDGKETQGYDFEITGYENRETEYFIACKGAKDDRKTFFLSEKEWNTCLNNNLNYQVYLIRNVGEEKPKIILIDNLIAWITSGKVRPGASKNEKVKAGQVMLTLV
jgi:hypothetical protein